MCGSHWCSLSLLLYPPMHSAHHIGAVCRRYITHMCWSMCTWGARHSVMYDPPHTLGHHTPHVPHGGGICHTFAYTAQLAHTRTHVLHRHHTWCTLHHFTPPNSHPRPPQKHRAHVSDPPPHTPHVPHGGGICHTFAYTAQRTHNRTQIQNTAGYTGRARRHQVGVQLWRRQLGWSRLRCRPRTVRADVELSS